MTPLVRKIYSMVQLDISVVWFDVGFECWTNQKWDLEILSRLPFESIAIVCRAESNKCDVLIIAKQQGDFVTLMAYGLGDHKNTKAPIILYTVRDGRIGFLNEEKKPIYNLEDIDDCRRGIEILQKLLESLKNGGSGYKGTPKPTPTNKRRAAKGKGPISVDWHTVEVSPKPAKAAPGGGTHASPRKHQRRGHWRNHPTGKKVWVKDCWVGNAGNGLVFKDYKVDGKQ